MCGSIFKLLLKVGHGYIPELEAYNSLEIPVVLWKMSYESVPYF